MSQQSAILFDFSDSKSADLASNMLQELGYEPVMHNNSRLHIHIEGSDLTSALEIAQSHGGQLVEQTHIAAEAITNTTYALNAITIPAHVVNEDLVYEEELHNWNAKANDANEFLPDPEEYNHLAGDVHI
ncbi:hypothetical protein [Paenibacillus sp. L3-i20]|uniref:hypothetical protein n=1 Tax=Paenibacillus sp. L3-i20 TaxID=2905833 RepID=UPI001EDD2EE4|nr:hypothetical protein [Paenibacillus sp. L3-i20]GKU80434.1 hypothetical protein L3i20_v248310 [Paenibacillus sp. L3-i20]